MNKTNAEILLREFERLKEKLEQSKKLYELTLSNEVRWMNKHSDAIAECERLKEENARLKFSCESLSGVIVACAKAETILRAELAESQRKARALDWLLETAYSSTVRKYSDSLNDIESAMHQESAIAQEPK